MAITGISSIDNKQIIAAGALSAISANQALITSGGDSLQGLYDTVSTNSGSWTGGGGGSVPAEVMSAASAVSANSANWDSTYNTVYTNSASWTGGGTSLTGDAQGAVDEVYTNSASWNETTDTLSANSGAWGGSALPMSAGDGIDLNIVNDTLVISSTVTGGGSNDAFYIYPGTTTDKEISENSAKDMRLYNSANNTYLDYAGKATYSTYAILDFKNLSGAGSNTNTVEHVKVRVYPTATSACSIYSTGSVSLLASTSTVSTASTAYYDSDGNYLATTRNELTALSSFIQNNSGSWTGGGGGGSTNGLIYRQTADYYGNSAIYLSGNGDVIFSVIAENGISTATIENVDTYQQDTIYFSPDYNFSNKYTASYTVTGNTRPILTGDGYTYGWEISAGNLKIYDINFTNFSVGSGSFNVNSTAYSTTGEIEKHDGNITQLTSWNDTLSNYQMTGVSDQGFYVIRMNGDQYGGGYNWEVTVQSLGGDGPTVTSADVFPPTTGLTPGMTYTLNWNDSYGLYWEMRN